MVLLGWLQWPQLMWAHGIVIEHDGTGWGPTLNAIGHMGLGGPWFGSNRCALDMGWVDGPHGSWISFRPGSYHCPNQGKIIMHLWDCMGWACNRDELDRNGRMTKYYLWLSPALSHNSSHFLSHHNLPWFQIMEVWPSISPKKIINWQGQINLGSSCHSSCYIGRSHPCCTIINPLRKSN